MIALAAAVMAIAAAAPLAAPVPLESAGFEDYAVPAGRMEAGVFRVELEARAAVWRPWGDDGAAVFVHVFAEAGAHARVPAPLIRVAAGTPVHVTVRNRFDRPLVLRGFQDRVPPSPEARATGALAVDSIVVAPGGVADARFTPVAAGTFIWSGHVRGGGLAPAGLPGGGEANRGMTGVFIVDAADAPAHDDERIFMITHWAERAMPATWLPATRFFINGRGWPLTERLVYEQHDTVRWRVLNITGHTHPMHLHGFYFSVDARGDLFAERVYEPADRRLVVTELLRPAETMRMTWVAEEPGNWVFHCHLMRHMSFIQHAPIDGAPPSHAHAHAGAGDDELLMGGLVLGITVRPAPGAAPVTDVPRRRLPLYISRRDSVFGAAAGYAFVLQHGAEPPAPDSMRFPGSLLELVRGEPTEIVVYNRADVALGVHWHGLELESRADGVPGWSGAPGAVVPAIAPGDSLAVRITPRRAGTFMYHVHSEPGHQLAAGLYGPFLVTEPGAPRDAKHDHYFLLGSLGEGDDAPPVINGVARPAPLALRAGSSHRLRFMHISPDDEKRVALLAGEQPVQWRWLAKDGAALPAHQQRTAPAELRIDVGETYDFEWTPMAAGDYTLRVVTTFDGGVPLFPRPTPPPDTTDLLLRVR
jgi:manganese oxidase